MLQINRGSSRVARYFSFTRPGEIIARRDDVILFHNLDGMKSGQAISAGSPGIMLAMMEKHSLGLMLGQTEGIVQPIDSLGLKNNKQQYRISDIVEGGTALKSQKNHRRLSGQQIYTGNIYIDLFRPICPGQLLLLKSKLNLPFESVITCGKSANNTFITDDTQASNYLLPFHALQYAIEQSKSKQTIFILDNLYDHLVSFQKVREVILSYMYPDTRKQTYVSTLLGALSDAAGLTDNSNLTVAIVANENEDLLSADANKELESLVSQVIENSPTKPSVFNKKIQDEGMYNLAQQLHEIIAKYESQMKEYIMKQKLHIHIDQWDFYAYFDGKFVIKMIEEFNKGTYDHIDMQLVVYCMIQMAQDETIPRLNSAPKKVVQDILAMGSTLPEFNGKVFRESTRSTADLARFYELFSLHLRISDQIALYKRDYI